MLIEALEKLATKAGAERISLEIRPASGGVCTVVAYVSLGHDTAVNEDAKNGKLLATLADPLVVTGNVGELDSRLVSLIDSIEDDFEMASKALPETNAKKRKRELNEAAENKKDKKTGATKKVASKGAAKKAEKPEVESTSLAEDLASGEAESL